MARKCYTLPILGNTFFSFLIPYSAEVSLPIQTSGYRGFFFSFFFSSFPFLNFFFSLFFLLLFLSFFKKKLPRRCVFKMHFSFDIWCDTNKLLWKQESLNSKDFSVHVKKQQ